MSSRNAETYGHSNMGPIPADVEAVMATFVDYVALAAGRPRVRAVWLSLRMHLHQHGLRIPSLNTFAGRVRERRAVLAALVATSSTTGRTVQSSWIAPDVERCMRRLFAESHDVTTARGLHEVLHRMLPPLGLSVPSYSTVLLRWREFQAWRLGRRERRALRCRKPRQVTATVHVPVNVRVVAPDGRTLGRPLLSVYAKIDVSGVRPRVLATRTELSLPTSFA